MGEAPPDDPLIGTMVQRYRLSRLLGAGGMGRVYEAEHPEVGARVAVKVLTSEEQDSVARFFAEARAVNLIRHEGIVDILDLTHLPDGRPCIIMEYLEGASLQVLLSGGAMGLGTTCRLTIQILDALGAAHEHGILHRDLKPDNIFVSPSGRATLVDFGVAKLSSGTTVRTEAGIVVGTVPYMSPEQAMDEPLDPRSDLFSIGVVLY
ncbi:MAG: serine/threonine protein kinase, partial [Deltaproteobacteria bacterium]|nr:serine/threonine protein kinase [Deltaproteobacteria bacterium]